jgi:predicted RNase H-like HicB family nuclease
MSEMTFTAVIVKDSGFFVAECPEVGTVSQGESYDAALANLKEATELYLEEFPGQVKSHPLLTSFEAKVG